MVKPIYTAEATSRGGGRDGEVTTSDGVLDEKLAPPKELGGSGGQNTNPEQLFAAGYAACFHSALHAVSSGTDIGESTVTATVGIGKNELDKFQLSVSITANLPGLEQGKADELAAQAHQTCPYSNATRGNIEVDITAVV